MVYDSEKFMSYLQARIGLNPYFTGLWSMIYLTLLFAAKTLRLNPYFTGLWSMIWSVDIHAVNSFVVLILILLDYGL